MVDVFTILTEGRLRRFVVCVRCAALVPVGKLDVHEQWHQDLEQIQQREHDHDDVDGQR
jgi:hypothetical protein